MGQIKIRDFLGTATEISDIFEACKHEIKLSDDDVMVKLFYINIYYGCLMCHHKITYGNTDIITEFRKIYIQSKDKKEVFSQYKKISDPSNNFTGVLLEILSDYLPITIPGIDFHPIDVLRVMIGNSFVDNTYFSKSYTEKILRCKINY